MPDGGSKIPQQRFLKDITRATVSLSIKQTIKVNYDRAVVETMAVSMVKAHEVRVISASLTFDGSVALETFQAHATGTPGDLYRLYLKVICWNNRGVFKLGPIVAAQQVITS